MDNYYQLLGLTPSSTTEEIRQRCLELGGLVRPDVHADDPDAKMRFDAIEEAFVTLTSPDKRRAYDALLQLDDVSPEVEGAAKDGNASPSKRPARWKQFALVLALVAVLVAGQMPWASFGTRKPHLESGIPLETPKAAIDANCSTNGFGQVSCSFTNLGAAKGGVCVQIELTSMFSKVIGDRITSDVICSGLVEPSDVRDRTTQVGFFDSNGHSIKPHVYCTEGAIRDTWPGQCRVTVLRVKNL